VALRMIVTGYFTEILEEADLPGVTERALEVIDRLIASADLSAVQVNDSGLREPVEA
jgi:hypothetical protein